MEPRLDSPSSIDLRSLKKPSDKEAKNTELEKHEQFLRTLGFSEESITKLKTERPALFDYVNGHEVVNLLQTLGFNAKEIIISSPVVLSRSTENIKQKIDDLKSLRFADPNKMIASAPGIFGHSIEDIKQKILDL